MLLHVRKESLVNSRRNAEYLAKLEHSMQQFKEGKGVVKTMDELLNMEK